MDIIKNKTFGEERALYACRDTVLEACAFDGPEDGESALKECANVQVRDTRFNLRYPLWHDKGVRLTGCELTEGCRAALWYTEDGVIEGSRLYGIKAVRECTNITVRDCHIVSPEFGWFTKGLTMEDTRVESEYFMLHSGDLTFRNMEMKGKYSFQYVENAVFEGCTLDTKDALWHGKNVVLRNCVVRGEYLGWYSENITFENCEIIGTQPLCYCKGLRLINCHMVDCDLAFERSRVEATVTTPVISVKNPLEGHIYLPAVGEVIMDIPEAKGVVKVCSCVCA